jgi:hypothetical protein
MPWQFGAGGIDFYREMEAIEDRIIAQALVYHAATRRRPPACCA